MSLKYFLYKIFTHRSPFYSSNEAMIIDAFQICQPFDSPSIDTGACSRLTLNFDKLSVLSVPKEAVLYTPTLRAELSAAERVN